MVCTKNNDLSRNYIKPMWLTLIVICQNWWETYDFISLDKQEYIKNGVPVEDKYNIKLMKGKLW